MTLWKLLLKLCKGGQRWLENQVSISRDESLKKLHHLCTGARDDGSKTTLPSPEMKLWRIPHHLCKSARDDEFENHENQKWIFEKSISIRNAILKNKESISICKMIPYFLGSHLWRGSREIVLRFQSYFIPDSSNDYMNLVQSIRVL